MAVAWFGLAWYGVRTYAATEAWLAGIVGWALLTLSGLSLLTTSLGAIAILATAAGVYLGWTATAGVPQPEAVSAAAQGTTADADRSDAGAVDTRAAETSIEEIVGGGLLAGIGLGAVLGVLGAVVFAWVSVQTQTVYGLLVILPALAAGAGVAVGVGDRAGRPSGLVAAALAVASIVVGFQLLDWWMPPFYELQPSPLLAIGPLVGIYLAYRIGSSAAVDADAGAGTTATDDADRDRPTDRSTADRDRDVR
ncbi:hypothetical protein [Halopenitus sp. POP-27]|uniref:hypothetical protein n=1 Tax=Halopenitus sp. POP-27 TaxID=2994425 RepID=UPI0024686765|nr:hypothetical protein [Halopenitus sp. POP-27]